MSNPSKKDKILESMDAPTAIDVNVNVHIPRSPTPFDGRKHKFRCTACGKPFSKQNGNFQKSNDVLFQANDGYLPWCKECTDKYVNQMIALYSNNEEHAIKNFCQRAGWNYDFNALVASAETYSGHRDRTRVAHYAAKKNINCDGRKTYIDTLKYEQLQRNNEVITTREQAKDEDIRVKAAAIDRWGLGFTEVDYKNLDDHYFMLKKNNPNADNNQEIFIKALCTINRLMINASQSGDAKAYTALVDQYARTFKQAGLRAVEEKDASNEEVIGVTLETISKYTPEEFYKDKDLYKDWDGIGEYMDRHVLRPLVNIMTSSDTRDKKYYVPDGDEEDE